MISYYHQDYIPMQGRPWIAKYRHFVLEIMTLLVLVHDACRTADNTENRGDLELQNIVNLVYWNLRRCIGKF